MELQSIYGSYLDKSNYGKSKFTIDILNYGYKIDLISKEDIYRIQSEVAKLLRNLILKSTKGQSSSIKVESAEQIMNSIWYALDAFCIKFESVEEISDKLIKKSLVEIYTEGIKIIKEEFDMTKSHFEELLKNDAISKFENMAYRDTINEAFPTFFKKYNYEFAANNTMATIDYPLAIEDNLTIEGLVYMKNYLDCLVEENKFIKLLQEKSLQHLLDEYSKYYKIDYRVVLINIFEIAICNMIFCCFINKDISDLVINNYEFEHVELVLYSLDKNKMEEAIKEKLEKAIKAIIEKLDISDTKLIDYLYKFKPKFLGQLMTSIDNKLLKNMLIVEKIDELNQEEVIIISGDKNMDDKSFRDLYNKILESQNKVEKINLIVSNINSRKDFIDILESNCLFKEEIEFLFSKLSNLELSLLGTVVFYDVIRAGQLDLLTELIKTINTDTEWKDIYLKYVKSLKLESINEIEEFINKRIAIEY
ncbi:hypothetical protein KQI18_05595 [Clostridioides mangenotii]|uniref:DUF6179 domain-containing protein n=1 Tax=Metaclostridioides mangenotii TaxID=1540 RepID=UPI001C120CBD|nr:DUF6179 domain-containing protein [Clostridioides mangenotii]MBU5307255.1 hypothetical protein [Clostridioides mangenotii]